MTMGIQDQNYNVSADAMPKTAPDCAYKQQTLWEEMMPSSQYSVKRSFFPMQLLLLAVDVEAGVDAEAEPEPEVPVAVAAL